MEKSKNITKIIGFLLMFTLTACANTHTQERSVSVAVAGFTEQVSPEYKHAFVDLNNDGVYDAVVLLRGMEWCGSAGCTMLVLQGQSTDYTVVSHSTVTREPVRISESMSQGWHDIIVHSDGVEKLMLFDGSGYPSNPSMQATATQERVDSATTVLP